MGDVLRLLFLLVENASRRFSGRCLAAATELETFRNSTLTSQPFANLSSGFNGFAGFTAAEVAVNSVAADLALGSEEYAMAILDVGLPRMDGFEVLARLRARGKNLPVLMLTARSDVKDRVHGLNLGADDYLAKPFELTELEARVKALLRRSVLGGERLQRCGVLAYDLDTRRFTLGEELLTLTSREQAVLEALIARPGRVMSKEQLASQVFGLDEEASPDAIEIYVHRLRKKLDGQPVAIVTFRGLGYLLESRDA
jgi:two-component system response regulator TctD